MTNSLSVAAYAIIPPATPTNRTASCPSPTRGRWYINDTGRTRILHGFNLSGSSEIPTDPLDEADEHDTLVLYDDTYLA